jgi:hypothetical protein
MLVLDGFRGGGAGLIGLIVAVGFEGGGGRNGTGGGPPPPPVADGRFGTGGGPEVGELLLTLVAEKPLGRGGGGPLPGIGGGPDEGVADGRLGTGGGPPVAEGRFGGGGGGGMLVDGASGLIERMRVGDVRVMLVSDDRA